VDHQELLFADTEKPACEPLKLRPYQTDAVSKVIELYEKNKINKQLLVLATGLGKTVIASQIIKYILEAKKKPALFVAHRDELLTQAQDQFKRQIPWASIQIEKAEAEASTSADIVIASVQSIGRSNSKRIEKFPEDHFSAIIVDESHHISKGNTYNNILQRFVRNDVLSIGITATPFRSDGQTLDDFYDIVAYKKGVIEGTKEKWLSPVVSYRISTKTDLSKVRITAGDYNIKDLSDAINNSHRNTLIVETYVKRFSDKKALLFGADIDHVHRIIGEFQSIGIAAEMVTGQTPKEERRDILNRFKNNHIKILGNFGIATEGFDDESLPLIIQARPTQSKLLLTQIVGRALRLHKEKEKAEIIEIVDLHSSKTATTAQIFGFRQEFDCEEHTLMECWEVATRLSQEMPGFNPFNCRSWSNMLAMFEDNKIRRENAKKFIAGGAGSPTERKSAPDLFFDDEPDLRGKKDPNHYDSRYRFYKGEFGKLSMIHNDKDGDGRYKFIIEPSELGSWISKTLFKSHDADKNDRPRTIFKVKSPNKHAAVKVIEDWILINHRDWDKVLWLDAPWKKMAKNEPCTEKQYDLIRKLGLSNKSKESISKSEAGDMISLYFNKK
jgi:superfamily II DNA or RNA helicase